MAHYAHSRPSPDKSTWQELAEHLEQTAVLSEAFAPAEWRSLARVAALWHDAGKYQEEFQRYTGASPEASNENNPAIRSTPHSAAGAALAWERFASDDVRRLLLALVIEAHHGSLKALYDIESAVLQRGMPLLKRAREGGLPLTLELEQAWFYASNRVSALAVRLLFSALVDADLLNTEAWDRGKSRYTPTESLVVLRDLVATACEARIADAPPTPLNRMRSDVYLACLQAARKAQGVFTLTVPTGGGKTLSGMAFALHHAVIHQMRRVIVVAPYTSILEQTAQVYRETFGAENVIEHHSNLDPSFDTDRNRQACENWDAPIIVTTSVQLFESLHAAHKAPCRKLHRIANSVILLDEVQTFPVELLQPIHRALKELIEQFGVTVVHGTATQPLLLNGNVLPQALRVEAREIIPSPELHFAVLRKRYTLHRVGNLDMPISPFELAEHIAQHECVLAVMHSRAEAEQLAELLGPECFHLSAAMCAAHRSDVIRTVRIRLATGASCRVVSTQLIEAGVDIDFPVVFRALAGLETLAQAAGRCNREMKLEGPGRLYVFRPGVIKEDGALRESMPPKGSPRRGAEVAWSHYFRKGEPDLHDPQLFPKYARLVLEASQTDARGILKLEEDLDFPAVAERFQMIDDAGAALVAPYCSGRGPGDCAMEYVRELRNQGPSRQAFRHLQRFAVTLRLPALERLYALGAIEPVLAGAPRGTAKERAGVLWMVREAVAGVYHPRFGFTAGAGEIVDPEHLIV